MRVVLLLVALAGVARAAPGEAIVTGVPGVTELAIDGDTIYFLAGDSDVEKALMTAPTKPGAKPTKLADAGNARGLVVSAANVVWGDDKTVRVYGRATKAFEAAPALPDTIWSVARDATRLAVGSYAPGGGRSKVSFGRKPIDVAGENPVVALDGATVFVGTSTGLWAIKDGVVAPLVKTKDVGVTALVVDGDAIYFVEYVTIHRIAKQGGTATQLAVAMGETYSIVTDDKYVYWGAFAPDEAGIYRIAKKPGSKRELVAKVKEPNHLVVAGAYLYWSDSRAGEIRRLKR